MMDLLSERDSRLLPFWMVILPGMNPLDNPCNVGFQIVDAFAFELYDNFRLIGISSLLSDDFHDLRLVVFGDFLEGVFPTPEDQNQRGMSLTITTSTHRSSSLSHSVV